MELKELTELLKKKDENPTDTILRVLGRFAEEHPDEVNKKLSPDEMATEILKLKKDALEKDELVQRLLSQLNDGGDGKKKVSTVVPIAVTTDVVKNRTNTTKIAPRATVRAEDLVNEDAIQDLSKLTEEDIESGMKNQEWAKTNSDMRKQVMKFIEDERKRERQ